MNGDSRQKQRDSHTDHRDTTCKPGRRLRDVVENQTPEHVHGDGKHVHAGQYNGPLRVVVSTEMVGPCEHGRLRGILTSVEDQGEELCATRGWIEHDGTRNGRCEGQEDTHVPVATPHEISVPAKHQGRENSHAADSRGDVVDLRGRIVAGALEPEVHNGVCGEHLRVGGDAPDEGESPPLPRSKNDTEHSLPAKDAALRRDCGKARDRQGAFLRAEVSCRTG